MRVLLLNDGGHKSIRKLSFPIDVQATYHPDGRLVMVHENELRRIGGDSKYMTTDNLTKGMAYFTPCEFRIVTDAPCIREMCCNQFGERDEMQSIINSLQADVIARGARIEQLECEVINLESEVNDLCGYDKYNA
jgi:hypothetical protein